MKKILYIIIVVCSFNLMYASRYAGDFIEIGNGVRALGMGGAYTAIADDASSIFWNASGISQLNESEISLTRSFLFENLATYDNLNFIQPLPNDVTIGVSWTRLSIDDIPYYSEDGLVGTTVDERLAYAELHLSGQADDYFESTDDLFQFGVSKYIRRNADLGWSFFKIPMDIYLGGNVKFIKRALYENNGDGIGFDLSMLYRMPLEVVFDQDWMGDFSVGVNFKDIGGTVVSWDTESNNEDEILQKTNLGTAYIQPLNFIDSELILSYDVNYSYETTENYGFEYSYKDIVSGRFGFKSEDWTAGTSVTLYGMILDYALVTHSLGNTHRVGLTLNF